MSEQDSNFAVQALLVAIMGTLGVMAVTMIMILVVP